MDRGTFDFCRDFGSGEYGCGGVGRRKIFWRFYSSCDVVGLVLFLGLVVLFLMVIVEIVVYREL